MPMPGPGALLGECAPRLLFLLAAWRQHGETQEAGTFTTADGSRLVRPHFAGLGKYATLSGAHLPGRHQRDG